MVPAFFIAAGMNVERHTSDLVRKQITARGCASFCCIGGGG